MPFSVHLCSSFLAHMKPESRQRIAVVIGFAAFMCVCLIVAYVSTLLPGARTACATHCAGQGKEGHLVYADPPTTKDTTYSSNCECGSPLPAGSQRPSTE